MQDRPAKTKPRKTPPTQRETKQTVTNHNPTIERRRRKKKKTQERERNLGEDVEQGVRVELVVRGHVEETQGESQTLKRGLGFPSTWERKKERKNVADEHPNNKKQRKEDYEHQSEQGAGLKGHQTKQQLDPEDQDSTQETIQIPRKHLTKKRTPSKQSLRGMITAGWRGPWAALRFLRRHPRGPWYRGVRKPPTTGTAPGGAKTSNMPNKKQLPQKDIDPALRRSQVPVALPDTVQTRRHTFKQKPPRQKTAQVSWQHPQQKKRCGTVAQGEAARRRLGQMLPPTLLCVWMRDRARWGLPIALAIAEGVIQWSRGWSRDSG